MQTVLLNKEVYDITFKKSSSIVVFTSLFQVEFIHHEVVTVGTTCVWFWFSRC